MTVITAFMSVWSDRFTPDQITERLGSVPDNTTIKGSERSPPRLRPPSHGWHVSVVREGEDVSPDTILAELVLRISDLKDRLIQLQTDQSIRVEFAVAIRRLDYDIPLFFNSDLIRSIASYGSSLDIEFFKPH